MDLRQTPSNERVLQELVMDILRVSIALCRSQSSVVIEKLGSSNPTIVAALLCSIPFFQ